MKVAGDKQAKACLLPLSIIDALVVFRDLPFCFFSGGIAPMIHEFGFQGCPEAFLWGVFPTILFPPDTPLAQGWCCACLRKGNAWT